MMKVPLNYYICLARQHHWVLYRHLFVRIFLVKSYPTMSIQLDETIRHIMDNRRALNCSVSDLKLDRNEKKKRKKKKRCRAYSNGICVVCCCLAFSSEHSQQLLVDDHHKAGHEQAKHFEDMLRKSIASSSTINPKDINLSSNTIDYIFIQLAAIVTGFYHRLNLPLRVCLSPSYELLAYESLRLTIEVYLPSQIDYVRVGSVSLIDDYLARRLMIKHDGDPKSYVAMVHARIADVSQLSKCVLEASQTIGRGIKLPAALSIR
jgi:hypothetical protein